MISLRVESGRQRKHIRRTELDAEPTTLAAFGVDNDDASGTGAASFSHMRTRSKRCSEERRSSATRSVQGVLTLRSPGGEKDP